MIKQGPGRLLAGAPAAFAITVSDPGTITGYNLSVRDVLPAGVSYVPGSTTPIGAGEPEVVADSPTLGITTLLWFNVDDVVAGGASTIGYRVIPDPGAYPVGSTFINTADSFVNASPRNVPRFDSTGAPVLGSYTGSATASSTTTIIALQIS